jgi:2-(3-amino-3-carboxypropyl)histidine synthase
LIDQSKLISELSERGAVRVSLQAPEGLKRRLLELAKSLRSAGFAVYISGDPCYGACDLDTEILKDTDILVHLGHAPVDDTRHVLYDIFRMDFDPEVVRIAVPFLTRKKIGLVTTVQHVHLIPAVTEILETTGIEVIVSEGTGRTPYAGQILGCSFEAARKTGALEILYLGTGQFHPIGVQISTGARVLACDPYTGSCIIVDGERLLRRRFALIEKAKSAIQVGIIISPKSGQCRKDLADRLLSLSDIAIPVQLKEVTPEQLLNLGFPCYVNTACPRLAFDDQVRWPVPVLSPQEFEIVCGVRTFEEYEIDEIR